MTIIPEEIVPIIENLEQLGKERWALGKRLMPCLCGKSQAELPMWFHTKVYYSEDAEGYGDEAYEDHMYRGCPDCGVTFCRCGKQHKMRNRVEAMER